MDRLPLVIDRLLLREFREEDWAAVHLYAADPEVVRHMEWGPNSEAETKDHIRRVLVDQVEVPRTRYEVAAVLKSSGLLIGSGGICVSNPANREGYIGYCFNRTFWGQGYATETARALVEFGFTHLGLHRVFATCAPANVASARVLEKVGMKREGQLREHKWAKGRWRDSFLYAILDYEWQSFDSGAASC